MSALPGQGTIVLYYSGSGILPAIVTLTPDSWNSELSGVSQPDAGTVHLQGFGGAPNATDVPEGTSMGTYALISAETPDV